MADTDDTVDNTDDTNDDDTRASDIKIDTKDDSTSDNLTVEQQIQKGIDEALAPIKSKLDAAFEARDEALAKVKEIEQEKREAELKRLEEEGKHTEAAEAKLADANAELETLRKTNTELTRDMTVKGILSGYDFRNSSANDMAFKSISENLIQNEQGAWVHRNGDTIAEAAKKFLEDTDNSFLLKAKRSSGQGGEEVTTPDTSSSNSGKSLSELPVAEVLKMAEGGNLRKR